MAVRGVEGRGVDRLRDLLREAELGGVADRALRERGEVDL